MSDLADVLHLPDDSPEWATWGEEEDADHVPEEDEDPPIC